MEITKVREACPAHRGVRIGERIGGEGRGEEREWGPTGGRGLMEITRKQEACLAHRGVKGERRGGEGREG